MNIITQFTRIQKSQTQGNSRGQRSLHSYFDDFSAPESKFNMQMGNDKKRWLATRKTPPETETVSSHISLVSGEFPSNSRLVIHSISLYTHSLSDHIEQQRKKR